MMATRGEIDWIEIQISILGTTNLKAMRRAVKNATCAEKVYVEAIGSDPNSASVFSFRIHDPHKFADVRTVLARLEQTFPFALVPSVTAVEIAIDNYSKGAEQVADWYYGLSVVAHKTNHRLYRDFKGSGMAIPRRRDALIRRIADGYQIGIGDKNADLYQHAYYKQTDHNKQPLTDLEHRARIEITLRRGNLPSVTLDDWENFKFEQLAKYFRFRCPKDNLTALEKLILQGLQKGQNPISRRKGGGTRLNNRLTKADPENEQVRNALRNLSRRWRSAHPGRPVSEIQCANSGNISSTTPNKHEDIEDCSNNYASTNLICSKNDGHREHEGIESIRSLDTLGQSVTKEDYTHL